MNEKTEHTGRCVCGAVTFTAPGRSENIGACNCSVCRQWGGGPLLAVDCGSDVTFEGEENITVFNSSDWADRGFCRTCGSHLFYRLKEPLMYVMPAGLFDDQESFTFDHQVFIEQKPHYYTFANKTDDMTGEELFAKFAPPEN